MKKLGLVLIFILGLAIIGTVFKIEWISWIPTTQHVNIVRYLAAALAGVIFILVALGSLSKGKTSWTAFLFAAILFLGCLVFDPTFLFLIGPIGLILVVYCVLQLKFVRT